MRPEIDESVSEGGGHGDGFSGSASGFSTITSSNGPSRTRASKGASKRKTTAKSPKSKGEAGRSGSETKNLSAAELMIKKQAEMSKVLSSTAIDEDNAETIEFENENYSDGEE